jgi:alkylation response protein AidB-like acyl-CoA dehydrogenase
MSALDLVRQSVRRFAREVIAPTREVLNHFPDEPLPAVMLPGLAELGLLDAGLDQELLAGALEELAEVAAAPAALVLAHAFGRELVRAAPGVRANALCAVNGGGLFATPLYAEPGLADHAPELRRAGGGVELDGVAELVVNAPLAKVLVLPVKDTDAGGAPAWVALESSAAGVSVGEALLTLGMRGCPTADVRFERARLPADHVLDLGAAGAHHVARRFRAPALALVSGLVASSVRVAREYAGDRIQGGRPILEHQEVRAILGRMIEDRALIAEAAAAVGREELPEWRSLALFLRAKERGAHATTDGVQLLGGNGYMEDYGQERAMRDARQAQCLFGRTDVARQELASRELGLGGAP